MAGPHTATSRRSARTTRFRRSRHRTRRSRSPTCCPDETHSGRSRDTARPGPSLGIDQTPNPPYYPAAFRPVRPAPGSTELGMRLAVRSWLIRGLILAGVAAVVAFGWVANSWVSPERVRAQLVTHLDDQFNGVDVHVGSARMRILGGIAVTDLRLTRRGDPLPSWSSRPPSFTTTRSNSTAAGWSSARSSWRTRNYAWSGRPRGSGTSPRCSAK